LGAILIGSADFYGGLASRTLAVAAAAFCGQMIGFVGVYLLVLLFGVPFSEHAFKCGLCAGACGAMAILCLYRGLAVGRVSVVAPLSALVSATVPVLVSIVAGHQLSGLTLLAVLLAFAAIYILSLPSERQSVEKDGTAQKRPTGFLLGLLAGLTTGGFYTFLGNADVHGNIWTICGERTIIVAVLAIAILARKLVLPWDIKAVRFSLIGGTCDFAGNLLYLYSAALISLHVVALITSLYPVSTLILGWAVLKERLTKRLGIGLAFALSSIGIFAYVNG
jgi:drug/metabolite transporter (DMT)-like permease